MWKTLINKVFFDDYSIRIDFISKKWANAHDIMDISMSTGLGYEDKPLN